ncbi:MAG: glycosyltransferase [Burkholderiales bacterium]|nr:MAG: glycosyltransferase [Burkholderiales bacterium]
MVIYRTCGDGLRGFRQVAPNVWLASDTAVDSIKGAWRCFYSTSLSGSVSQMKAARQMGPVVYEYIDHMDAAISGGKSVVRQLQALRDHACNKGADLVVVSARTLESEIASLSDATPSVYVPNGVDVGHYAQPASTMLPEALTTFRMEYKTIVGYFGAIAPWLWYEVLDQVAQAMPDAGFVFIGPDYAGCVPSLPQRSNVVYLGPVPYSDLPAHARLFDVCLIPFRPGEIARSTSPLKLFEYFALEKPVVVTSDLQECTVYPEVFSGSDRDSLVDAIHRARIRGKDEDFRRRLRCLAHENDWSVRARVYSEALDASIQKPDFPSRTSP